MLNFLKDREETYNFVLSILCLCQTITPPRKTLFCLFSDISTTSFDAFWKQQQTWHCANVFRLKLKGTMHNTQERQPWLSLMLLSIEPPGASSTSSTAACSSYQGFFTLQRFTSIMEHLLYALWLSLSALKRCYFDRVMPNVRPFETCIKYQLIALTGPPGI